MSNSDGELTPSATSHRDVRRIDWDRRSENQPVATSQDGSRSSPGPSTISMALRSSDRPPKKMTQLCNSKPSGSPPSASHGRDQQSSMGRTFSRAGSAFRSKSRSSSRSISPEVLPADSTPPTSFGYQESPSDGSLLLDGTADDTPTPSFRGSFKSSLSRSLSSLDGRSSQYRQPRVPPPKSNRVQEGRHRRPSISAAHESVRTSQSRVEAASAQNVSDSPAALFPHDSLIKNIYRFMRYSSAAYGVSGSPAGHQGC